MYTKLIIRFQGLWNKRRKRYRNNNVHALRALHMPLIYMYKCTWVEHNITFIWAAISRSVTPSSFYLFENKNVSNLDTNLINEASSLSVTGNLCPWNSFFLIKQNNYPSFYFYCILNLLTGIQIENVTILHELYVYTPVPWYDKNNQ